MGIQKVVGTVVSREISESGDVVFLYLKLVEKIDFQAGQFCMLYGDKEGTILKKPYSIGTTPQQMHDDGTIGFIVKRASESGMSDFLTRHANIGETLEVQGPLGHMVDKQTARNYLFVSTGSGLSPIYSLYRHLLGTQSFGRIAQLYGERHHEHMLSSVEKQLLRSDETVYNQLFLSRESRLPDGYTLGRIQQGLPAAMEFLGGDDLHVFLCGKPVMVDEVKSVLEQEYSVPSSHIFFEKY